MVICNFLRMAAFSTWRQMADRHPREGRKNATKPAHAVPFCFPRSTRATKAQHACVLRPPERGRAGCQLIRPCQAHRPPLGLQVPYALYSEMIAVKSTHVIMS